MMSVQRHQDLVEEASDDDDDAEMEMTQAQILYAQMHARGKHWPKAIGVVEIVTGMLLVLLGQCSDLYLCLCSFDNHRDATVQAFFAPTIIFPALGTAGL